MSLRGILSGWPYKVISNPRGAWTALDQIKKGNPARSFKAQNVRFAPGHVYSREGTSARLAVSGKIGSLHNWVGTSNLVIYVESGTTIKAVNVATDTIVTLVGSLTGIRGLTVAEAGPRAYIASFATTGLGAAQCYITDGTATVNDKAFHPPINPTAWTAADNGAGLCTKGTHRVGFIFQDRTGFAGKPSPAPADVFTSATVTLAANKRTIRASLTWTTPATAGTGSAIYPIITRSDNPDKWYFVPGMSAVPPASSVGWTYNFDISVSDEDLAARAESADNWFNALSQVLAGTGPFNPSVVFSYGHRNVYIVDNKAYVSDIDDAQFVTEDFNVIQTAGQRRIYTGFALRGSMYLFTEKGTWESSDGGDYPATWGQPKEVSGGIGTTAPLGVCSQTLGDYAWVAAESGLYVFTGAYPAKPISYLQSDQWKRINWAAAYAIQVKDDTANRRVYVAVPLDAATEPSHLFIWDYTNGLTSEDSDFSWDVFNFAAFSSIGMVKEATTARTLLWIGPSAAGSIVKSDDTTHDDSGAAIDSYRESGWIWDPGDPGVGHLNRIGACHVCVNGSGNLNLIAYGKDRTLSVTPTAQALSAAPGYERFFRMDLCPVEECSIRVGTNAVGAWFDLTELTPYWKSYLTHRY